MGAVQRCRDDAGCIRGAASASLPRATPRADGDGRRAHAARELPTAGAGVGACQAGFPVRGDVKHGPRLYLSVRQGRARHRRRHGRLYIVQPDRRPAHHDAYARRYLRPVPDFPPTAHVAELGRHCRCHAGSIADYRKNPGAGALCQLRLGYRRLQGNAGSGTSSRPWRGTSRIRSPRPSPSNASRLGG